jgi:hypothetical protein
MNRSGRDALQAEELLVHPALPGGNGWEMVMAQPLISPSACIAEGRKRLVVGACQRDCKLVWQVRRTPRRSMETGSQRWSRTVGRAAGGTLSPIRSAIHYFLWRGRCLQNYSACAFLALLRVISTAIRTARSRSLTDLPVIASWYESRSRSRAVIKSWLLCITPRNHFSRCPSAGS